MNRSKWRTTGALSVAVTIAGLMLLGTSTSWAQQKGLKGQLAGAWTLVSQEITPKGGGAKRPGIAGPNAKGLLILDASGRYAVVTGAPDRAKLKVTSPRKDIPAAELAEAVRSFGGGFGTWSVNEADKTLIRKSELSMIPNNIGIETKASVSLAKDELKLVLVSPTTGNTIESVYRRAK